MLFNSIEFLVFFPIVAGLFFIIPKKFRCLWLLIASYYFYMSWNPKYAVLIAFSTFITYISGILMERANTKHGKQAVVAASFIINLAILGVFKYANFALQTLSDIGAILGLQPIERRLDLLLPVGISFYTFQALSYTIDVYRGTVKAEKNILQYMLFVSFFPQLVAGPIERSGNLLSQIQRVKEINVWEFERVRNGFLLMFWGLFQKLVIADRASVLVNQVYQNYGDYGFLELAIASVLFAFQIYCDFAGYSTIAIGAAEILGFSLMENFNCPYFSLSIGEFWRRWHISLSSWFRDYLYIPLGGNRKGTTRKYVNLMIVFLVSGLWHGAAGTYVVWGFIHGVYQVIGGLTKPMRNQCNQIFALKPDSIGHKALSALITFILVDFAWIFFRAESLSAAIEMIKSMVHLGNISILWNGALYDLGIGFKSFLVLMFGIAVLLFADFMKYKGIQIRKVILEQELWCRWLCYLSMALFILVFGIWGGSYDAASFIYFQF